MAATPDSLAEWAARLADARVAVIGDLVLDEYVFGLSDRISREAPVVIVRETRREHVPGGAANVVANVLSVGASCLPVGVVGRDAAGRTLSRLLSARGALLDGVLPVAGRPTDTKTRILAGGQSTTPQQVLRLDHLAEGPLTPADRRALQARLRAVLSAADVLVVSDYGSGVLDAPLRRQIVRAARRIPVLVDSRFDLRAYAGATVIKPNAPEMEALTGVRVDDAASAARAARGVIRELDLQAVLVTRGHEGLTLQRRTGRPLHLPVFGPPEAVDVTGAGDTVMAVFAAAMGAGAPIEVAVRLANVAGGVVVQKPGTATVDMGELVQAAETGSVP